jgi:hypothetical protein
MNHRIILSVHVCRLLLAVRLIEGTLPTQCVIAKQAGGLASFVSLSSELRQS